MTIFDLSQTALKEKSLIQDDSKMKQPESHAFVTFKLGGGHDIFESIMTQTYKGEMGPVKLLIKDRFNGMAYLNEGRWHFAIPHISKNQTTVFTSTFEPLTEEDVEESSLISNNTTSTTTTNSNQSRAVTTIHNPHKKGVKRLQPYHVRDIKELFERGGYTLDTVK